MGRLLSLCFTTKKPRKLSVYAALKMAGEVGLEPVSMCLFYWIRWIFFNLVLTWCSFFSPHIYQFLEALSGYFGVFLGLVGVFNSL